MTSRATDKIEESGQVLKHEIEKLDELGLTFAASLVRIAHVDLLMRIHNVTGEAVDILRVTVSAVEKEIQARRKSEENTVGQIDYGPKR